MARLLFTCPPVTSRHQRVAPNSDSPGSSMTYTMHFSHVPDVHSTSTLEAKPTSVPFLPARRAANLPRVNLEKRENYGESRPGDIFQMPHPSSSRTGNAITCRSARQDLVTTMKNSGIEDLRTELRKLNSAALTPGHLVGPFLLCGRDQSYRSASVILQYFCAQG
jgi:hypothetical protein